MKYIFLVKLGLQVKAFWYKRTEWLNRRVLYTNSKLKKVKKTLLYAYRLPISQFYMDVQLTRNWRCKKTHVQIFSDSLLQVLTYLFAYLKKINKFLYVTCIFMY